MSQDSSARSDLPAGGQEELGGVSHSERMMADMMKMLANLTVQNQQLLQQPLQQQQQTAGASGDCGVQQQTVGAADNRGLQQQMAAGDGGHVQEFDGAREGRVVKTSGSLVRETSVKQESLSGEGRQASLAGSYPGFRVIGQTPIEDVPRRDDQRGESGTIRGFGPVRESAAMFGFGQGVLSRQFLCSMVNKSRFLGGSRKLLFTPDGMVSTRCSQGRLSARTLTWETQTARWKTCWTSSGWILSFCI